MIDLLSTNRILKHWITDVICSVIVACFLFAALAVAIIIAVFFATGLWYLFEEFYYTFLL